MSEHPTTFVIPQSMYASIEHRRVVHGEPPHVWTEQWHAQIRYARFCLLWPCIAAQMTIDVLSSPGGDLW